MTEMPDMAGDWRAFVESLPAAARQDFEFKPEEVYVLNAIHGVGAHVGPQMGLTARQIAGYLIIAAAQQLIYNRHGVGFAAESIATLVREGRRWIEIGTVQGHA